MIAKYPNTQTLQNGTHQDTYIKMFPFIRGDFFKHEFVVKPGCQLLNLIPMPI
jgi:hypothetical protein